MSAFTNEVRQIAHLSTFPLEERRNASPGLLSSNVHTSLQEGEEENSVCFQIFSEVSNFIETLFQSSKA